MKRIIRSTKEFMRMTKVVSQYNTISNHLRSLITPVKEEVVEAPVEETVVVEEAPVEVIETPVVEQPVEKKVSKPRAPRKKVVAEVTEEPVVKKAPRKRKKKDA